MSNLLLWAEHNSLVEKIELRVRASNAVARQLYARFGFIEEGRFEKQIKFSDGTYLADISMAKFSAMSATKSGLVIAAAVPGQTITDVKQGELQNRLSDRKVRPCLLL